MYPPPAALLFCPGLVERTLADEFVPKHAVLAKGFMLLGYEHTERAVKHLRTFRRQNKHVHDAPLYVNYASLLCDLGRLTQAERVLTQAVKHFPQHSHLDEWLTLSARLGNIASFSAKGRTRALELLTDVLHISLAQRGEAHFLALMRVSDLLREGGGSTALEEGERAESGNADGGVEARARAAVAASEETSMQTQHVPSCQTSKTSTLMASCAGRPLSTAAGDVRGVIFSRLGRLRKPP